MSRIIALASGHPKKKFTQEEMIRLLQVTDDKRRRFFLHPHVKTRHFLFDESRGTGEALTEETLTEQREKFLTHAPKLSAEVLGRALQRAGLKGKDLGCLVTVSASGYFTPGLSVFLAAEMDLPEALHRIDVAGMGCHAGLNALQAAHNWCETNPGKTAAVVCAELGSCIYNTDESDNNALVNALFGDGVAVVLLCSGPEKKGPEIIGFKSHLIPDTREYLRFDWLAERNLYGFQVHKKTPATLGAHVKAPLSAFLSRHGLGQSDVSAWVVHGGGEAILSAIQSELGLTDEDLRHTRSVLRDYGNVASASFLFSLERLREENTLRPGEKIVFMTMGPGLSLEFALASWA